MWSLDALRRPTPRSAPTQASPERTDHDADSVACLHAARSSSRPDVSRARANRRVLGALCG
jgi:hypothetical protein